MGLDMWIYGVEDISNDNIPDNMDESWYEEKGYNVEYKEEDDTEFEKLFHDLEPYAIKRNVRFTFMDWNKIKDDYNIPEHFQLGRISSGGVLGFYCGREEREIEIPEEDYEKYHVYEFKESFIFKVVELAYWRKHYDLQELIHNEYNGEVYNCGFHLLDDVLLKKINKFLKREKSDTQRINNDGYIAKMYHEWY